MIEGPAFYPMLSARDNLKVLADIGGFPKSRVNELLELVGLADRGSSKFKTYSLGMKQRIGIDAALLPQPQLLILDEPTNGLDPNGIQEIRELISKLAQQGTSVFVSSHILSELEMISEYLVMLRKGKLLYSGRTQDLLGKQRTFLLVKPEYQVDLPRLVDLSRRLGYEPTVDQLSIRFAARPEIGATFNRAAFEIGVVLSSLTIEQPSLEETFFEMTGDN
jgi:ABC-2 type transport system ATP-binding protein